MFVIRRADFSELKAVQRFYNRLAEHESLGCLFVARKHGNGPQHYTAEGSSIAVEIYPLSNSLPQQDALCFEVHNPKIIKTELINDFGGKEPAPHIPTTKSGIVTLCDPGGRFVLLFPQP